MFVKDWADAKDLDKDVKECKKMVKENKDWTEKKALARNNTLKAGRKERQSEVRSVFQLEV